MKNILVILCIIFLMDTGLYSQEGSDKPPHKWIRFLHLESGFIFPTGTIKESIAIRQNISSYYVDQPSNGEISSETFGILLGIRWEYFNTKLKTGVSTGLRYTGYGSEITGYTSGNANFFYLRYSMADNNTKFARVKSIGEINNFISIPLEVRIIPVQVKGLGLFAKAGIELSKLSLVNKTTIDFQESSMDAYHDIVLNSFGITTNKLYSTLYGSGGWKFGKEDKTNYLFEIFLPSLLLTKNNFNLTDIKYFQGFKFSIQFRVKN